MDMTGFDEKELEQLFTQYHPDEPAGPDNPEEAKHKCPKCGHEW